MIAAFGMPAAQIAIAEDSVEKAGTIDPLQATGVYTPPPKLVSGIEIAAESEARSFARQKQGQWLERALRWRPVRINTDAFFAVPDYLVSAEKGKEQGEAENAPLRNTISVTLFPGETFELHNTSVREWHNGALGWSGKSKDESIWGRFTVSAENDLGGYLRTADGRKYSIKKVRGTLFHVVVEVDPTALMNKEF